MAASKGHVDSSVAERRLRPIYDWLDNGNNKKAIQEADKVLKKQPDFLCAKVLKALGLLRIGKNEECDSILESVRVEAPVDESTLQAMTIAYREMHQINKICSIYDSAVQRDPNNEELQTHLFMAYVRVGDFKKQQMTARNLYKIKNKNPYYFWGVMSVVMQTRVVPEQVARTVVLPLAEKMVVKMVEMGKVEAEQEVQLYLMILEMQDKIQEALDILDGPLGERLVSHLGLIHTKKAALLARLNRWREAHLLYKNMLLEDQDRWNYYQEYFRTSIKLWNNCESERHSEEEQKREEIEKLWNIPDVSPKEILEFLNMLSELNTYRGAKHFRAPFLAKMELFRHMMEMDLNPEKLLGDLGDLINAYFVPFGSKPCCFSDLKLYLPMIPRNKASALMKKLWLSFDLKDGELPLNLIQMQRHINLTKISRCLGVHENLGVDEKVALVKDLLRRYDYGGSLESNVNPTDFPVHDAYALIACHILHELSISENKDVRLAEAAVTLEHALNLSPSNFHFKLLLLRIYSLAGAGEAAQSIFTALDVKHMQLDSLGWLHCAHLSSTGFVSRASAHFEVALKFFLANYKDSLDHLTYSYKFGSFLKISEFVEFRDRLHNSHHYTRCSIERMLSELLMPSTHEQALEGIRQMDIAPSEDNIEWEKLRDNRDLDVVITFDPKDKQLSADKKAATFKREVAVIKLRRMQLRCLAAAFELVKTDDSADVNGASEDLLPKLTTELKNMALPPSTTPGVELNFPLKSRADILSSTGHLQAFISALQLTIQLADLRRDMRGDDKPALMTMNTILGEVTKVCTDAVKLLDTDNSLFTRRGALEAATNSLETLSFVALLCGVCRSLARPSQPGKKGKKKKEPVNPVKTKIAEGLVSLAKDLQEVCSNLHECVGRWEARVALVDEATEFLSGWSLEDSEDNPINTDDSGFKSRRFYKIAVTSKLRHSFMESSKELQNMLLLKCKHFAQFTS